MGSALHTPLSLSQSWHLVKASLNDRSLFHLAVQKADGTSLLAQTSLPPSVLPPSLPLDSFSLTSSLTDGKVSLARTALYSYAIPNNAALQFASRPASLILDLTRSLTLRIPPSSSK